MVKCRCLSGTQKNIDSISCYGNVGLAPKNNSNFMCAIKLKKGRILNSPLFKYGARWFAVFNFSLFSKVEKYNVFQVTDYRKIK